MQSKRCWHGKPSTLALTHNTLILMRDELWKIAAEESTHSALAWRTLNWICDVDPNACNAAHSEVFDRDHLEMRIHQVISNERNEVLQMIHLGASILSITRRSWECILMMKKAFVALRVKKKRS
ncbi:LOW QUALITY PROTEIN: hypothetical protein ACHAWO_013111 [Cyclotella atomus]|uniref:Uncharacterized protein n=1 Tax=Cyclotella atomus TaxID=382360 RepID=A0ABD3Q6L6_9STRA